MGLHHVVTLRNIQELFFRMEVEEGLFSMQMSDGSYFWDVVRRDVYLCLHAVHGGPFAQPQGSPPPSLTSRAKNIAKTLANSVSRRYLTAKAPKYIFITYQRLRSGTRLIDNISDHLYDLLEPDSVAIELANKAAIRYRNMLTGDSTRLPPVRIRAQHVDAELARVTQLIRKAISRHFEVQLDIDRLVADSIGMFRDTRDHYRKLFSSFRPKAIVGVNNGTLSGMYLAAKEGGVPTVELQHGASTYHTIFWSYPTSISPSHPGLSLPTAYFTYSEYWNTNTHFPVKFFRSIGTDYFYQEPAASPGHDILMISSYMYRDALLGLALELAARDTGRTVFFKLHPHEFDKKAHLSSLCQTHQNIRIVCDEFEFPELFRRCRYVVGVQSTAIYLALQARKRVCLLKHSNYFWHEDVFNYVELFDTADELHALTQDDGNFKNHDAIPDLFRPFREQDFLRALDDVQQGIDAAYSM